MKLRIKAIIVILVLVSSYNLFSLEKKGSGKNVLSPGQAVRETLDLSVKNYKTFKINLADDVYAVDIILSGAPADLDLFVKHGQRISSYDDVDYYSSSDSYNEKLVITRMSDPTLKSGTYYIDVAYQRDFLPVAGNRRMTSVPFTIEVRERKQEIKSALLPGRTFSSALLPENGMADTYSFRVPDRTPFFRIDISGTSSDLDLMVAYENKIVNRDTYDYISETLLGKEFLVVRNKDKTPLKPGIYYITVFDQVSAERSEPYSVTAGFDPMPPGNITEIPEFPPPQDEFENALQSTVEVIGEAGKGSGCLVSSDGYIITNWHVVRNYSGTVSENIYIAVNMSYDKPPEELFKASLVDYSEESDLALLKITSGIYGQPVDRERKFPHFSVGAPAKISLGQPVSILGYPGVGGTGSRASISLTTGIVSGFEDTPSGSYIKTDAEINGGNSGGAVIDVYYNLIGLPTVIIGEDSGQIGYITPVSDIPSGWYRYISR